MGKVHTRRFTPEEEPHPSAYSRQEKQTDVERKTKGGSSRGRPPFRTGLPSGRLRSCPPVSRATRPSSQRRGISRCTEGERNLPKQRQERDGPACPNGHGKGGKLAQNLEKRKSGAPSSSPSSRHVASKMSASSSPQHKPRQSPSSCLSSSASPSRPAIPTSSLNGEGRQTRLGTLANGRAAAPAAFSPEGRASEDCLRPDSEAEEGRRSPVPCVGFLSEETSRTTSRTPRTLRRTAPEGKSGETRFFSSDTHSSSSYSDALSSSVHASGQTSSQPPRTSSPSAAALRSSSISSSPSSRGSSTVRSSCASPLDFVSRKSLKSLPSPDLSEFLASRRFRGNQGEAVVTQELEETRARRTGAERRVAEMSMQQSALGARAGELLEGDEKLRARLLALAASSPSALSQKTADVPLLNEKETDEMAALRKASPEPRLAAELYEARKREPTERGPRGMPEDAAGPEETRAAQRDGSFREEGEELRKSRRREREEKELLRVLSSSETAGGCLSAAGEGGNTREAGERRQIKGRRGTVGIFEKEKERDFAGLSSGDGSDGEDARKELDSTRRSRRKERGRRPTCASSSSSAGSPAFSLSSRVSSCGLRHVSQRKAETSQSKKERQTLGLSKDHAGALSGEERDADEKPCFGRKRVLSVEAGSPELRSPHPGECREQLREKKRRLAAGAEPEEVEERDEASRGDEQGDNGSGAKAGRRLSASLRGAADQRVTRSRLAVVEKLGVSPLEEKRHRSKKSRARFISLSFPTSELSEEAKAAPRQLRSTARDALEPRERGRLEPVARRQEQAGCGASEGEAEEQEGKPERGLLSPVSREVKARVSEALVASLRLEKGDKKEALKEKRQTQAATSPKKEEHDQDKDEQSQGKDELPEKEKEAVYLSRLRARSSCLRAPHARWVARWLQELYRWDEEVEDSDSEGVTWWHALSSAAGSSSLPETTKRDPGSRRSCRLADRAAAPPSPSRPPGGDVGALFLLALSAEGERHPGGQQVLSLLKRFSSPTLWSDAQPRVAFLDKTSGAKQLPSCLSAGDLSAQLPSVGAKAERGGRRPEAEDAEEESEEAEKWKTCFSLLLAAAALPAISIKGTHRVADQHHVIRFLHITDKLVFSSSVRPGPGVAGGALSAEPEAREPQSPALLKPAGAGKATRESERDARRDGQEETERYRKREDGSRFAVKNERDTFVLSSRHRRENQLTNTHELQARLAGVDWQAKLPPLPLAPNGCSCCCCFNASHSSLFASSSSSAASLPSSPSCAASSPSCAASSPSCAALSSSSSSTSASASLTSSSWTSFSSVSASSAPASASSSSSSSSSSFASSLPLSASHAPSLERNGLPPTVQVETPALLCSSDLASNVRPECTTLASLTPDPSSVGEPSRGEPASQAQLVCCHVAAAVRAILARSYRKQMLRNARERGAFAGRKEPRRTEEGEADLSESHSLQQAGQPADGAVGDNATKETELKTHREAKGEEDEANGEARGEKGGCVASSRSSSACDSVSKASVEGGLEGGETEREVQIAEMVKQRLLSLRDLFPFLKTLAVALCTKFLEDTNAKELAGARELHGQRHTGTEAAVHQQPQTEGEETLGRRPDAVGDKGDSKMRKHKLPGPLQGVWRETLPDGKSVWMVDNELGEHGDRDAIETLSTEKPCEEGSLGVEQDPRVTAFHFDHLRGESGALLAAVLLRLLLLIERHTSDHKQPAVRPAPPLSSSLSSSSLSSSSLSSSSSEAHSLVPAAPLATEETPEDSRGSLGPSSTLFPRPAAQRERQPHAQRSTNCMRFFCRASLERLEARLRAAERFAEIEKRLRALPVWREFPDIDVDIAVCAAAAGRETESFLSCPCCCCSLSRLSSSLSGALPHASDFPLPSCLLSSGSSSLSPSPSSVSLPLSSSPFLSVSSPSSPCLVSSSSSSSSPIVSSSLPSHACCCGADTPHSPSTLCQCCCCRLSRLSPQEMRTAGVGHRRESCGSTAPFCLSACPSVARPSECGFPSLPAVSPSALTASGRPLAASLLGSRASVSWDEEKHAACLSFWEEGEEGQGGDSSWTPEAGVETEDQAKGGTKDKTEEKTDGRKRYFVFASQAPASLVALLRRTARQEKEREAEAGKKKDQDGDTPAQQVEGTNGDHGETLPNASGPLSADDSLYRRELALLAAATLFVSLSFASRPDTAASEPGLAAGLVNGNESEKRALSLRLSLLASRLKFHQRQREATESGELERRSEMKRSATQALQTAEASTHVMPQKKGNCFETPQVSLFLRQWEAVVSLAPLSPAAPLSPLSPVRAGTVGGFSASSFASAFLPFLRRLVQDSDGEEERRRAAALLGTEREIERLKAKVGEALRRPPLHPRKWIYEKWMDNRSTDKAEKLRSLHLLKWTFSVCMREQTFSDISQEVLGVSDAGPLGECDVREGVESQQAKNKRPRVARENEDDLDLERACRYPLICTLCGKLSFPLSCRNSVEVHLLHLLKRHCRLAALWVLFLDIRAVSFSTRPLFLQVVSSLLDKRSFPGTASPAEGPQGRKGASESGGQGERKGLHAAKDASGSEKARQKKDQRGGGPAGATAAKTALLSRRLLDSLLFPPCPKHLDAAIAQVENARFHQRCVSAATSLLHLLLAKETEHYLSSCWSSVSSPPASSESLFPLSSASEKALSRLMSRLLNTVLEAKVPGSGTTAHFLRLAMCFETQASGKTCPSRFFQLLSRRDQTLLSSLVATAAQKKQLLPHPSSSPSGGEAETSALLHTVPTASNLVSAHLTSPFFDSRPPPVASDQRRGPGDPLTSASPFFSASFSSTLPLVFRAGERRGKRPLRVHQLCNEEYELYEETPGGSSLREPDVGGSSSRFVTAELSSRGSEAAADASSSCSPLLSSSLLPSSGRHGESSETQVASLLSRFSAKAALTDNARRFLLQFLPVFASSKMLLPSVVHAALAGGCICGRREAERGGGDASWSVENEDAGGAHSVLSWSSCLSPLERGFGQRLESCGDSAGRLQVARELQTPQTSNEGASHALASSLKAPPASSRFACSESRAVLFSEKENANWFPNDERKREDDEREKHRAEARETEADKLSREGQTTVDRGTQMSQNEEEGGNGENGGTGKTGGAIRVDGTARAARGIQEGASEQVRHQMRRRRKKLVDERCCMFPVPLRGKDDGRGAKREKSHDCALFSLSGFQGKGLAFAAHDFFETGGAFFSRELPEFRFSFASVLPPTCSLTRAASTRWRGASTSHSAAEESGASPAAKCSVSSLAPASARLLCARRDCRPQELSQASEGAQERAEEEQEERQLNSRNERKREGDGGSERAGEQQTQRRGRGRESGVEIESRTGENERDGKREMERASYGESERKREMGRERETTKRERERDDEAAEGEVEGKKRQVFSTSTRALDSHVFVRGLERESDRQAARRRVSCSRERFSWYEVFALTPLRLLPSGSRVAPTKRGTSFSSNERARLNCLQFASHDGSSSPVSSVTCPRDEEEAAKGNGLEEPTRRTSGLQCAPSLSPTVHLGSPNSPSLFSPSSLPRLALSPGVSSSGSHRAAAAPPGEGEAAPAVETSKAFSETSETAESRRTTRGGESETAVSFQRHLIVLLPSLDPQASATAFARRVAPVRGDVRSAALSQAGIEARNTVLGESETHLLTAAFAPEARLTQICHRHTPQEEANLSPGARLSATERCSSVWSQGLLETAGATLLPASLLFVSFPLEMVRDPSPSQTPSPAAAGSLCVDVRERKAKGIWGETGTRDKGGRASEVFPAAETAGRDSQREQGTESKLAEVECAAVSLVKEENEVVSGEKRKRKTNTDVAWTFLDFVTSHSSRLSFVFREARAAAGEAGRSGTSEETGDRGKQRSGETDGHRRPGLALAVSRLRAQEGDSLCGEKGGGAEEARRANEIHAELCATKKGNRGEKEDWRSREKETSKREHNQTWSFSAAQAGTVAALGLQLWVPLFCEAAQLLWGDGQSEAEDASEGEKTNREEEQKIYGRAERNREGRTASSPLRCDCEEARGERKSEDADLEKSHCMQRSAERHSRYPPDRQEKQDVNRDRQLETRPTSEHSKRGATSSVCASQEHNIFTSPSSPPSSGSASYAPCSSSPSCAASFAGPVAGEGGSATECSPEGKTVSVSPRMQRAALRQLLEILDDEMHLERSEDETDEREALEDEGAERKVGGGATDGEGGEESEGGAERGENWRLSQKSQSARNKREFAVSTLSACLAFQRKETATQEGLLRQDERAAVAEHRSPSEEGEARQSEQGTQRRDSDEERQEESSFPCHDSRVQSDASLPPSGARPLPAAVAAVAELVFSRLLSVFLAFLQAQEELRAAQETAEEIQESLDQRLRPRSSLPERAAETHPSSESERRENGSCFEAQEMEKLEVDREGKRRRLSRVGTTARARARVGDPHLFLTASSGPATQGKEAEGEAGSDKREERRQATECGCSGGREPLLQAGANGLKSAEMPDSRCATSKGIREDAGELEQARKICEIARGAPQRTKQAAHATERTLEGGKDDSPEKNGDVEWAQCALSNILLSSPTVARECVAFGGFGRLPDDTRTGLHFQLTPFIARVQRGIPLLFRHQLQRSGMRQHDLVDAFASLPGLGVSPYSSSASSVSAEGPRSSAVLAPLASGLSPSLTAPGSGLEKKGDTRDGLEDERRRARRRDEKAERKAEARDEESATREKKEELDWTRVDIFAWDLTAENGLPCRDSAEDSSKEVNSREPPSPLPSSPSSRASLCSSSAAVCVPEPPPSLSRAPARMARSGGDTVGRLVSDRNDSKKKRRKHKPLVVKKNSKASALCVASGASRSHGSQNGQLNPRTSSRSARRGAFSSRSLPQSRPPCVSVASLGILKTRQRPLAPQQSTPSASPSVLQSAASAGLTHGKREERKRKSPRDAKTGPSASPVLQGDATLNLGKKRDTSSPGENSRFAPPLVGSSSSRLLAAQWQAADPALLSLAAERMQERNLSAFHGLLLGEDGRLPENAELQLKRNELFFALESQSRLSRTANLLEATVLRSGARAPSFVVRTKLLKLGKSRVHG
ncbi:putative histone lysine methyltransferase, SET, partial [Toxoplasma gondii FOU]